MKDFAKETELQKCLKKIFAMLKIKMSFRKFSAGKGPHILNAFKAVFAKSSGYFSKLANRSSKFKWSVMKILQLNNSLFIRLTKRRYYVKHFLALGL